MNIIRMQGREYGRLRVVKDAGTTVDGQKLWLCVCSCGNSVTVRGYCLRIGKTQSCGCLHREMVVKRLSTHGETGSPEYRAWAGMKSRCHNPKYETYKRYGGRGISVCDRWQDSFENFLADMGRRPSPQHSIDRIDNDGNYEPSNCRWATMRQQQCNRGDNSVREYMGETKCISEWARDRRCAVRRATLYMRMYRYGWSFTKAFTTPVRYNSKFLSSLAV